MSERFAHWSAALANESSATFLLVPIVLSMTLALIQW